MGSGAQAHSPDKLCLADRGEFSKLMGCYDELWKSELPDIPELRDLSSFRLALEECISDASDGNPSKSLPACSTVEGIDQADLEWQQARELEAAVTEREERLRSMRADVDSAIEQEQTMQHNGSVREDMESSDMEENMQLDLFGESFSNAKAEREAQVQHDMSILQDEIAICRQYLRVAEVKAGELAKRRKSLLPLAFNDTDSEMRT